MKVFFFIICLFSQAVLAHQGTLNGHIYDATTNKRIGSTTIAIKELSLIAVTNELGEFTLKSIDPGSYSAVATSLGFEGLEKAFQIVDGETTYLDFFLKAGAIELAEIKVQSPKAHT